MDNKKQVGKFLAPGSRKPEGQYEIADFARKHGLTAVKASEIVALAGSSREAADTIANKRKPLESRGF
jgi:hypothetical protein